MSLHSVYFALFFLHYKTLSSRFPVPSSGSIDNELLVEFLGSDLNPFFSSITEPTDTPILAVENLGVEGSGGTYNIVIIVCFLCTQL